jgi:putative ABC transport system permease protein
MAMTGLQPLDEGVRIAVDTLWAHKVRSILTILGVAIGVSVVVTMAALITGIRSEILGAFDAAGPDNFGVMPFDFSEARIISNRPPWWGKPEISDEEIRRVSSLPGIAEAVVDFDFQVDIDYEGDRVAQVTASGNTAGWPAYQAGDFVAGRDFLPSEVDQARPIMIVSKDLAESLFGDLDPVGKSVRVRARNALVPSRQFFGTNERFEIVGVYELEGNIFSQAVSHFAIFPWRSADKRLKARNRFSFINLWVVPEATADPAAVQDQVIGTLRAMRGLRPWEENDFAIVKSDQIIDVFNRLTGVFFVVMLGLSSVGLLVGGIGVVGIMMISVTERTREIGVRKAVGATRREILWQFLVEAAFLTVLGGGAGMALGAGVADVVARLTPIPAEIPLWSVAAAIGMAIVTGMLFGLVPAMRAARMEPVVALRYE